MIKNVIAPCASTLLLLVATAASAQVAEPAELAMSDAQAFQTDSEAEAVSGPFTVQAVSEVRLHAIAGREDTSQVSQADLKAGVANNSVGDNSVTGAANIDGNAFQNMSGLSILNVNTGNNVAINAAMNVNISISPAP